MARSFAMVFFGKSKVKDKSLQPLENDQAFEHNQPIEQRCFALEGY